MLQHAGHDETGRGILSALEDTLAAGVRTRDLGGKAGTEEMTAAVVERISG